MFKWLFGSSSAPRFDPIGDICHSLAFRWWEWKPDDAIELQRRKLPALRHISGAIVAWAMVRDFLGDNTHPEVWFGHGIKEADLQRQQTSVSNRLYGAILANAANQMRNKPFQFTTACQQLAAAVQAGQFDAAYGIIDEIQEHHQQQETES